ncbi:MAG TPA: GspE/PulE family protein [Methylibium sp.]|uniref:GspE/PulE family protein n=1 Tax=Methylibium sp. TaxID=2067992 RepID=UPI002DBB1808|nr:GspE/PulE family protein [Methylibium sp.]HEU4460134.1 GspE/PulE family protein [Methylibium sp.]
MSVSPASWSNAEWQAARRAAQLAGEPLLLHLARAGGLDDADARTLLARRGGAEVLDEAAELPAFAAAFDRWPPAEARRSGAALARAAQGYVALLADPLDAALCDRLGAAARAPLALRLAPPASIASWIDAQEAALRATESVVRGGAGDAGDAAPRRGVERISLASLDASDSPAVRLVNSTLYDALRLGASDIHFECTERGLVSRFRIDGLLEPVAEVLGAALAEQAISRIKVLAELDIAERRVPQDGSFRIESGGREIDLRVSVMPGVHGEDAVIRVLDRRAVWSGHDAPGLEVLGFGGATLAALRRLARLPYGMLLVTGPTGSGKTTTLYGALAEGRDGREKVVTIEDPVEYQLDGVLQIPVNARKGLTFAKGLRSILRHDPDKIMVGEIRDRETAEIAIQSALTGHLVLTTLHANSVFDVFGRFQHLGVDVPSFVSALNGVSAQRLVRVLCRACAVDDAAPPPGALSGLEAQALEGARWRRAVGCPACRGSGWRGRRAVAEVLPMTPELAELVSERRPMRQWIDAARAAGVVSLRDDALRLVREGQTTLAEVARVTLA